MKRYMAPFLAAMLLIGGCTVSPPETTPDTTATTTTTTNFSVTMTFATETATGETERSTTSQNKSNTAVSTIQSEKEQTTASKTESSAVGIKTTAESVTTKAGVSTTSTATTTTQRITTATIPVSTTTQRQYIKTVEETATETGAYKYGLQQTRVVTQVYALYSDGSKELLDTREEYTYNTSGYTATDTELVSESNTKAAANLALYQEVLRLVNEIRIAAGVAPLTLDTGLCQAATMRAVEMNYSGVFAHTRPDGRACWTAFDPYGISYKACGENIAAGYPTAAKVVEGWKNSPGHYKNMVSADFGKMGVGMSDEPIDQYGIYWTQLFTN